MLVDLPGQAGLSDERRPAHRERSAWYGRWLSALLDMLTEQTPDAQRITVLGWSLGAAVALASASPRIGRQVLVSPGGVMRLRDGCCGVGRRTVDACCR